MAKVLAKAEKYINNKEALLSKQKTLPRKRRKVGARKSESGEPEGKETKIDPHKGAERIENGLQRDDAVSGTTWAHPNPSYNSDIHLGNSPP